MVFAIMHAILIESKWGKKSRYNNPGEYLLGLREENFIFKTCNKNTLTITENTEVKYTDFKTFVY